MIPVLEIRQSLDKERANELKKNLPSVCFSGKFGKNRTDSELIAHSGMIVLDFDNVENFNDKKNSLMQFPYVHAAWVSPSGNGVKALIKIADGKKHREHFQALQDIFTDADKSGINPSRVCYESYDPEILINLKSEVFATIKKTEKVVEITRNENHQEIFNNILKWLSNKGDAFVKGERNLFMFKLASACSRFGLFEEDCLNLCNSSFLNNDNDFTRGEAQRTVKSAYKANSSSFGTASFENEMLVTKTTRKEITINSDIYNTEIRPKDVVFGEDVKGEALRIYEQGYESASTTYIPEIDVHFKFKRGEVTLLSGIGNYGKSTILKYLLLIQVIKENKKFAFFSPEDNPASEFYHDLVEMYFGQDCTPTNPKKPNKDRYEEIYDMVSKHIFYVYPKDIAPTPDYIKERFLELIIKEKVDGCIIDPFNQLTNDYKSAGGRSDKYLEIVLSDLGRFAQCNNCYFVIVAHPVKMRKEDSGNYPCPDVFDIADGAMWNNKMDNILIYHRPDFGSNPDSNICEFHSKKIRRQKIVGRRGMVSFELSQKTRRFFINGRDYMQMAIDGEIKPTAITGDINNWIQPTKEEIESLPF